MKVGDSVITYEGKKLEIRSIKKVDKQTKVYNFEVEDYHTYYVSEQKILVHNSLEPCDNDLSKTVKKGSTYSDDLVKQAQKLYPDKAGKTELHHPTPKYLGGAEKQALVPLDAAYHQMITNEFRRIHPYGSPKPSPQRLQQIMDEVYSKFPLPGK